MDKKSRSRQKQVGSRQYIDGKGAGEQIGKLLKDPRLRAVLASPAFIATLKLDAVALDIIPAICRYGGLWMVAYLGAPNAESVVVALDKEAAEHAEKLPKYLMEQIIGGWYAELNHRGLSTLRASAEA